jgi:hypothetical protein
MKKLFFSFVFAAIAAVSFGQVSYTEIAYDSLSQADQEMFSKWGSKNPFGANIKPEADSVVAIFYITGIKKSREMVMDTVAGKKVPTHPNQYMTVYLKGGKPMAAVSTNDPRVNGSDSASIIALMSSTGLKQGDDEFPNAPSETTTAPSYTISSEW